ncbi:hypothetical protein KBZ19_10770 [Synechococcus sp. L2F]|uniref:hypothetical protein n=1 Tax=Synechococcus sp. L2F TaxID=2823739 RepID=UPI0020CCADA9|nr:hypothetical protein [Synechococcus sp. L2F]MCP9828969.1 hypothetical protein [Synechococcus sp. L2F]
MNRLLHAVGAIVVVPYVVLALFFLCIGEVARARGLGALIEIAWNSLDWFAWGIYLAPALWVCLVATDFIPSLQRASSLCLCLLAAVSFLVVVTLSSNQVGIGEFIFLLPCIGVAATSAWLFAQISHKTPSSFSSADF